MKAEEVIRNVIEAKELFVDPTGKVWKKYRGQVVRAEHKTPQGYLQVRKMVNRKRYHTGAHRVVWEHFYGPIPEGCIVNHINGIKDDNRPENLEVSTHSENAKHASKTGLKNQYGEKNPAAKLTNKQVAEIRLAYACGGYSQQELAQRYGVSSQHISRIVRGDGRKRELGATQEYVARRHHKKVGRNAVTGQFIKKEPSQFPIELRAGREVYGE